MENAIYVVSVKNIKDTWLDKKEVHYYTPLFKTLQNRLGDCKIIVSPICECLQFAGLLATSTNPTLNIVNELIPMEKHNFLSGVPSSLQHTSLHPLLIPDFTSLDEFSELINYLNTLSMNSIIFLQDSSMLFFNNYVELRKDAIKIAIYRVNYKENKALFISSCNFKKDTWNIKVKNATSSAIFNTILTVNENKQEIGLISKIEKELKVKLLLNKEESRSDSKRINDKFINIYCHEEVDLFGMHICIALNEIIISNEFHIPEFEVHAALVEEN